MFLLSCAKIGFVVAVQREQAGQGREGVRVHAQTSEILRGVGFQRNTGSTTAAATVVRAERIEE